LFKHTLSGYSIAFGQPLWPPSPKKTPNLMFEQAFKNIDDVLWKESGCTTELDYTEQTSWLLFLKYLDASSRTRPCRPSWRESKYAFILD
jgi:hypothetical protein